MITGEISFHISAQSNYSYRLILKNSVINGLLKSRSLSVDKKKPLRAQIFRYFRYESRNNNLA